MEKNFSISIDVAGDQLGTVLNTLDDTPGIIAIHLQLANRAATPRQPGTVEQIVNQLTAPLSKAGKTYTRGPYATKQARATSLVAQKPTMPQKATRGPFGSPVQKLICEALNKAPLHYKVLAEIVERRGMSGGSVNSALSTMVASKSIERVAPGTYRLTKLGQRRYVTNAPMGSQMHGRTFSGATVDNRVGLRGLILGSLAERDLTHKELIAVIAENGYGTNNVYRVLPLMKQDGLVKRVGDTYEITDRGRQEILPDVVNAEELEPFSQNNEATHNEQPEQHGE